MPATMKNMIALAIIFSISLVDAVPYSKYGRSCNDIGCPSNEVCVIAEDPCTYSNSQCGRYPTCKKIDSGSPTCSTMNCPTGQKCRMDNGRPVCIKSQGYDSTLNAQDTNTYDQGSHNSNPFQNANAPPADDVFGTPVKPYPGNSGSNLGYPPYPSNTGSNNGYPPNPPNQGSGQQPSRNDGYPPYPTNNNRMPLPGQANYPNGQPGYSQYPNHPPPGYQQPNGQRYPGHSNYPSPNYPNSNYYPQSNTRYNNNPYYRRNGGAAISASSLMMFTTTCFALLSIFRSSLVP